MPEVRRVDVTRPGLDDERPRGVVVKLGINFSISGSSPTPVIMLTRKNRESYALMAEVLEYLIDCLV